MAAHQKKGASKSSAKQPPTAKKQALKGYIALLILVVLLSYLPVFKAGFVNWDDDDYVVNNTSITSFSNFTEIITKPVQGNYHPLTMLSLALNYSLSGKDASSYHVLNLLLHMMNTVLVFFFVLRLSDKKIWMAFTVALLFGIHPLHVESVAWVSERKDLLYSLFFIAGLSVYLTYLRNKKISTLAGVFLLFLLSVLSKPAAIIFPLVLLALDYFNDRLKQVSTYVEKIPFLAVSVFMGWLTIHGQSMAGATAFTEVFTFTDRMFLASYGVMMYILKAIYPLGLCAFYPFPDSANGLPSVYYLSVIFPLLLLFFFIKSFRTNKWLTFSILFYVINLALVLQLLPFGNAVIADRYAYLPMLGIFLVPGYYFQNWLDKQNGKLPAAAIFLLVLISFILIVLSNRQAATWKSGETLWDHALKVTPSSRAYILRGLLYKKSGEIDKAFDSYNHAIELSSKEPDAWVNRGNIYFSRQEFGKAIEDYTHCLSLNATNLKAYENRGAAYASTGELDLALKDLNKALELDSVSTSAYGNRAMLMMDKKDYEAALKDFSSYFRISTSANPDFWGMAAEANFKLGNFPEALNCYNEALGIRENALHYLNRSVVLKQLNRKKEAYDDALKAKQMGASVESQYLESLQ